MYDDNAYVGCSFSDTVWKNIVLAGVLKHRKVFHFGYEFSYETNFAVVDGPFPEKIPESCERIIDRIMDQGLAGKRPNQLTVNVYQPGQGIPFHFDTHSAFEDAIISLSLLSPVSHILTV